MFGIGSKDTTSSLQAGVGIYRIPQALQALSPKVQAPIRFSETQLEKIYHDQVHRRRDLVAKVYFRCVEGGKWAQLKVVRIFRSPPTIDNVPRFCPWRWVRFIGTYPRWHFFELLAGMW
jgi:hypothetical protein